MGRGIQKCGETHRIGIYLNFAKNFASFYTNLYNEEGQTMTIGCHLNNWEDYLKGIMDADEYAWELWNFLQADTLYRNKTSLFITNDHGRHLNEIADGFLSHGDSCLGCQHINLFAVGLDFKKRVTIKEKYSLIDLPVTIGELMGFYCT